MTPEANAAYVLEVLTLLDAEDDHDIFWRVENGQVRLLVNCSDLFYWACADSEEITPENLPVLRQCYEDLKATGDNANRAFAQVLFCARVRGMRPQGACYLKEVPEVWLLLDACGPTREVDFGNPHDQPEAPHATP